MFVYCLINLITLELYLVCANSYWDAECIITKESGIDFWTTYVPIYDGHYNLATEEML